MRLMRWIGRLQDMGDDIQRLLHQQEESSDWNCICCSLQINPHFLYNTLNSIRLMATLQGKNSIAEMIEALGRLLRANLQEAKNDTFAERKLAC